jgi:SAM-dependent methyltransferase
VTDHDFDWAAMADALELQAYTHSPYLHAAFDQLEHLTPHRVLDIGSGSGVAACLLAQRFGDAEVFAVDGSPQLLARAEQRAERFGVRLRTRVAQFPAGAWSTYPMQIWCGRRRSCTTSAIKSGRSHGWPRCCGRAGCWPSSRGACPLAGCPAHIGFGRPGLQPRLDTAMNERFNRMRAELPDRVAVIEDWPAMLRAVGLVDARSQTFLVDHPAPLADGPHTSVRRSIDRQCTMLADYLDADDLATLNRLLDPDDPAGLDHRHDVFLLVANTVHFARRPE